MNITTDKLEEIFNALPKRAFTLHPIIKLSKEELVDQLLEKAAEEDDFEDSQIHECRDELLTKESSTSWEAHVIGCVADDSDIQFDKENLCELSIHEHNGYHFVIAESGGDWEYPVTYIIYPTEDGFKQYTPEDSNTYNHASQTAFGSEGETEALDSSIEDAYESLSQELQEELEDVCGMLEVVGYYKITGEICEPGGYDINSIPRVDIDKITEEFVTKFGIK
jgi:hypothetical protein